MTLKQANDSKKWQLRQSFMATLSVLVCSISSLSYEILSNPDSRETYDRYGLEGLAGPGGGHSGMDPGDIFSELFGDSFHFSFMGGPGRPRKGQDSIIPYEVTLEDLYNGKSVKMNMEKEVVCTTCQG